MGIIMTTTRTTVFKSNKTRAIRLPKPVALPDSIKKADIVAIGNTRIITPAGEPRDQWFDGRGVSDDFMSDRDQPADQEHFFLDKIILAFRGKVSIGPRQ